MHGVTSDYILLLLLLLLLLFMIRLKFEIISRSVDLLIDIAVSRFASTVT